MHRETPIYRQQFFRFLWTGCRFTARISNLFLVLHKCNVWIYFLLLLTQVDFFGTTFYFLESTKFSHYFYFLKSRIFGMYLYFLESSKVIYFWQHWFLSCHTNKLIDWLIDWLMIEVCCCMPATAAYNVYLKYFLSSCCITHVHKSAKNFITCWFRHSTLLMTCFREK